MGYRLEPLTERVPVVEGTAIMVVTVRSPPPEALPGQMVTSPCLLLAIERKGVSAVRMQDQYGTLLGQVKLD